MEFERELMCGVCHSYDPTKKYVQLFCCHSTFLCGPCVAREARRTGVVVTISDDDIQDKKAKVIEFPCPWEMGIFSFPYVSMV